MKADPANILLVEDNPDHAEMIMRLLNSHYNVLQIHHLRDGQAALDYLTGRGEFKDHHESPTPRLILLDLRLPKVDGLDVLKEIKTSEALRHIPVVVLTTSEAESDISRACNLHVNSYLVKPMNLDEFDHLIEMVGNYWLTWNHH